MIKIHMRLQPKKLFFWFIVLLKQRNLNKYGLKVMQSHQILADVDDIHDWLRLCCNFGIKWNNEYGDNFPRVAQLLLHEYTSKRIEWTLWYDRNDYINNVLSFASALNDHQESVVPSDDRLKRIHPMFCISFRLQNSIKSSHIK